jgi:hypothetical protein
MPGARPGNAKNLNYFDAIFFFGLREIELSDQQKADLMSFISSRCRSATSCTSPRG